MHFHASTSITSANYFFIIVSIPVIFLKSHFQSPITLLPTQETDLSVKELTLPAFIQELCREIFGKKCSHLHPVFTHFHHHDSPKICTSHHYHFVSIFMVLQSLSILYKNSHIVDFISNNPLSCFSTKVLLTLLRPSVASVNMTADAAASCDPDYGWRSIAF